MALICFVLLALGCGSPGKAYQYPLDDVLRLDEVQVKGTHNSYHVQTTDIPEWEYTLAPLDVQLDRQVVRQVELDLNWVQDDEGDGYHFEVYHVPLADEGTTCRLLTDCLTAIAQWSAQYPGHLPIYIQMEPKSGFPPDMAELPDFALVPPGADLAAPPSSDDDGGILLVLRTKKRAAR